MWGTGPSDGWDCSRTMRISSSKKDGAMASLSQRSKANSEECDESAASDTACSNSLADGRELNAFVGMTFPI